MCFGEHIKHSIPVPYTNLGNLYKKSVYTNKLKIKYLAKLPGQRGECDTLISRTEVLEDLCTSSELFKGCMMYKIHTNQYLSII